MLHTLLIRRFYLKTSHEMDFYFINSQGNMMGTLLRQSSDPIFWTPHNLKQIPSPVRIFLFELEFKSL